MPEYIFQHHRDHSGLYNLYAQHFEQRWRDDDIWPAAGFKDTELGVSMKPEVRHGATQVYARV